MDYLDIIQPKYLTREFLDQYKDKKPPFGQLGLVVFLRTYSRYIDELKRREHWYEIILRVVEFSMSLFPDKPRYPISFEDLRKEAEELYDLLFSMRVFAAGRTMFTGGTKVSKVDGTSQFNCSFTAVKEIKSFVDAFYLLLCGAGVGFSVENKYVSQLPKFSTKINLTHKIYEPVIKNNRIEESYIKNGSGNFTEKQADYNLIIGDSRKGWVQALELFFNLISNKDLELNIIINYDNVRPEGERLKTFGGRASGHQCLITMFDEITSIIKNNGGKLSSVDAMDIMNSIAKAVIVGGVRRSSQIAFGDNNDVGFIEAKKDLWDDDNKVRFRTTRVLSNNTIVFYEKPSFEKLTSAFETIKISAEPGIANFEEASRRRPNMMGSNPCFEILLTHQGVCNLTTQNLLSYVKEDNTLDWKLLERGTIHATRMGSRITNVNMWDKDWDYIQKRDRLLGVSLTGVVEAFNKLNASTEEQANILNFIRKTANEEASRYHNIMGIPSSLLVTCTKPEGSLSQLPTVSSGCHAPYAPFYKRRIRVSKTDPMAKALFAIGMTPMPENGQGDDINASECNTWIFTFPVKTNAKIRAIDESAIDQLERYKLMMTQYVDHTCSITVTVAEHEWDDVANWVYNNWDSCIGIAFLPRFDPSEGFAYPNMPYETCTEEEYNKLASTINLDEEKLLNYISLFEQEYEEYELDASCGSTSACPIR